MLKSAGEELDLVDMEKSDQRGYTLVEAIISAAILGIVAAGVASVTMMTSRLSYSNIYENTAYNVAQAYAEQIKSISYSTIRAALDNPVDYTIPTESLMLGTSESGSEINIEDPLTFGVAMEKDIVVDIEIDEEGLMEERIMKMWFLVSGTDLESTTNCWDAIEINIDFSWEVFDGTGFTQESGEIQLLKTSIAE